MNVSQINFSMKYCLGLDPFNQQKITQIVDNCIQKLFSQAISHSDYQISFDSNKHQIIITFNTEATLILEKPNNSNSFRLALYNDFQNHSIKVMAYLS